MNRYVFALALLMPIALTGACLAGIPQMINYQGMLTDSSGAPLNGTFSMTFKIYNDDTSTDPSAKKWEETQGSVSVEKGLFNATLGSVTPIELDFSEDYWLEVTVDGETMPVRLKFTSVGFAYRALVADSAIATTPGAGSRWTLVDSVLYTSGFWGLARDANNVLLGGCRSEHVNLGVYCTTGVSGQNYRFCTVSGGTGNSANGLAATVPGGSRNKAQGSYSLATGYRAKALHAGSFVWADSTEADFSSTKTNQFSVRAANGLRLSSDAGASTSIEIGERYRDNAIVAWGKIGLSGALHSDFGINTVTHNSAGNYTIDVNVSASTTYQLVPVVSVEVDAPPLSAPAARLVYMDQIDGNTFKVYITDGNYSATDEDFTFIVTAR